MFGTAICLAGCAEEGIDIVCISRGRNEKNAAKLDRLSAAGCTLAFANGTEQLTDALRGCDAVVVASHGRSDTVERVAADVYASAVAAGVPRIVPDEFGCDTKAMPPGNGALFDAKKNFQRKYLNGGALEPVEILRNTHQALRCTT